MQPHKVATNGFEHPDNYELARPRYPIEAIEFIQTILPSKAIIGEIGAGTGIFTKFLIESPSEFQVTCVEPVDGMRKKFKENLPNVEIREGTSWNTGFKDQSLDAVIVAQAFHWFDDIKTLQEFNRILKPDGKLLLIWNMESKKNTKWVEEIRKLYEVYDAEAPQYRKGTWKKVFETDEAKSLFELPYHHKEFDYQMQFLRHLVYPRISSKSYIAILSDDEKEKLHQNIERVLDNPDFDFKADKDGRFIYPHETDLFWCQRK